MPFHSILDNYLDQADRDTVATLLPFAVQVINVSIHSFPFHKCFLLKKHCELNAYQLSSNLHVSAISGFSVKPGHFVTTVQAAAEPRRSECLSTTSVSPAPGHAMSGRRAAHHLHRCNPTAGRASLPPGAKAAAPGDQRFTAGEEDGFGKAGTRGPGYTPCLALGCSCPSVCTPAR